MRTTDLHRLDPSAGVSSCSNIGASVSHVKPRCTSIPPGLGCTQGILLPLSIPYFSCIDATSNVQKSVKSESLNNGKDMEIFSPRIRHLQVIRRPERARHSDWDGTKWRDCALNVSEPISIILPPSLSPSFLPLPSCVSRDEWRECSRNMYLQWHPRSARERE